MSNIEMKTLEKYIKVRKSKIHGRGLFTTKKIDSEQIVIEYTGEKITVAEGDRRAEAQFAKGEKNNSGRVYLFTLNKRYYIDGSAQGNRARLINHSCHPNCETIIKKGRIFIMSIESIAKGEELTYDYGFDVDNYDEHPCNCGHEKCVGYIVGEHDLKKLRARLRRKLSKKIKKLEK